jgi:two-component system, LytTR family, sensor kinase
MYRSTQVKMRLTATHATRATRIHSLHPVDNSLQHSGWPRSTARKLDAMDASLIGGGVAAPQWFKRWLLLTALWSIPGIIQATTWYAAYQIKGDHSMSLGMALAWRVPEWQVWALATPIIVWVGRRWPITQSPWPHVPIHFTLAMVVATADIVVNFMIGRWFDQMPYATTPLLDFLPIALLKGAFFELIVYGAVLIVDQAISTQRRYREAALIKSQLEARLVEAQLDALKHQLHPHFLFNTINAITVLMRKGEGASAIRMLGGLSDLLRRSLTSLRVELVSLDEELDFIARYLDIETTRFPDRLSVTMDVTPDARRARVPNMLLQPIVENAIEHGIAPRVNGGRITIHASVAARQLRIEVRDDGVGLHEPSSREGFGVGLSNVRKRLAQLYPDAHSFRLERSEPSGAVAVIEIPFDEHVEAECAR